MRALPVDHYIRSIEDAPAAYLKARSEIVIAIVAENASYVITVVRRTRNEVDALKARAIRVRPTRPLR